MKNNQAGDRTMRRRDFIKLMSAAGIVSASGEALALSGKTIIYISARNCKPCREFEAYHMDRFKSAASAKGIIIRRVDAYYIKSIRDEQHWPDDLKFVLGQFKNTSGTPRFLVMQGNTLIENAFGIRRGLKTVGLDAVS